ncbi:unnamed protein product, partial [Didymodactylos carnosus]
ILDEDIQYINERLQTHEYMNKLDALNTMLELENYYTGIKNGLHGQPSEWIDKAWYQHILNTQMYFNFTQLIFGSYLHHIPFLLGNRHNRQRLSSASSMPMYIQLNNLGIQHLNETV